MTRTYVSESNEITGSVREDRFVIIRFEVLQSKDLSPSEKLVYARICGFREYYESKEECAEVLGISKDTVIKAKQKLVTLGYIREIGNSGRGKIYQPIYDDSNRVVKSTNQSGKIYQSEWQNLPIRVVKFTTIEEIENKDRINNNILVETQSVYDLFIKKFNKNPNSYKLTDKRKMKIKQRLKDAGKDMLTKAIDNVANSPFYMGDNDRGWTADLDFIIRSYEQVERLSNMNIEQRYEQAPSGALIGVDMSKFRSVL